MFSFTYKGHFAAQTRLWSHCEHACGKQAHGCVCVSAAVQCEVCTQTPQACDCQSYDSFKNSWLSSTAIIPSLPLPLSTPSTALTSSLSNSCSFFPLLWKSISISEQVRLPFFPLHFLAVSSSPLSPLFLLIPDSCWPHHIYLPLSSFSCLVPCFSISHSVFLCFAAVISSQK